FSPDGKSIAVGFHDSAAVRVLSASTIEEVARPSSLGVNNGNMSSVTWSTDGRYLFAGGRWANADGRCPLRRWPVGDWSHYMDAGVADQSILDLAPLPDRRLVFAAGDPAWGILGNNVVVERFVGGKIADLTGLPNQLYVSEDGRKVRFAYRYGGKD